MNLQIAPTAALTAALIISLAFQLSSLADDHPNIVLILADDLGWADTTLYGNTSLYETPNIQRLAARGMTFSSAYASPICSPTRASIMTGQNPARHGMTAPAAHLEAERFDAVASDSGPPHQKSTNVKSATRLNPELPMLGKVLNDAGYSTAHFGKWHLGREPPTVHCQCQSAVKRPLDSPFPNPRAHGWIGSAAMANGGAGSFSRIRTASIIQSRGRGLAGVEGSDRRPGPADSFASLHVRLKAANGD